VQSGITQLMTYPVESTNLALSISLLTALIIVSGLCLYFYIPWVYSQFQKHKLEKQVTKHRILVITLDDGPGEKLTQKTLEMLSSQGVRATYFLLGRNISGREELVRQIAKEGHEICSHGFDHLHAWKIRPGRGIKDIKKGWEAIDKALGTTNNIYPYRPPNGKLNLVTLIYLWVKRVPVIYWTADIGDTWLPIIQKKIDREWAKIARGAVVLAHDFDRATDIRDQYVLESLGRCLVMARQNGLDICSMAELKEKVG